MFRFKKTSKDAKFRQCLHLWVPFIWAEPMRRRDCNLSLITRAQKKYTSGCLQTTQMDHPAEIIWLEYSYQSSENAGSDLPLLTSSGNYQAKIILLSLLNLVENAIAIIDKVLLMFFYLPCCLRAYYWAFHISLQMLVSFLVQSSNILSLFHN